MVGGLAESTDRGTPQGGPLSPLLSNIRLDDLDKELERRSHCFCRYADDCNIYVATQRRASARVDHHLLGKEIEAEGEPSQKRGGSLEP